MTHYPVALEVRATEGGLEAHATTALERALKGAVSLQSELRCIEIDYEITLAAVKAALASAGRGRFRDPRAYWFAGKYLVEFLRRLESHGFYLVKKNITPAKHLGTSRASVEKWMAFHSRYPDPFKIDASIPWSAYRDNRESQRKAKPFDNR